MVPNEPLHSLGNRPSTAYPTIQQTNTFTQHQAIKTKNTNMYPMHLSYVRHNLLKCAGACSWGLSGYLNWIEDKEGEYYRVVC